MKTSSIAVETSRSTTQSDSIVRQTNKRSSYLFTDWAQSSLGDTILVLPLPPAIIALFVSHLYSPYYACSTVSSYLSAIGYAHKLAGVNNPTETAIIRQILKGNRKLAQSHDVRLPITLPLLTQLIGSFVCKNIRFHFC